VSQADTDTAPIGTRKMTVTVFPASAVYTPKKPTPANAASSSATKPTPAENDQQKQKH
jgi:hypothetical protein